MRGWQRSARLVIGLFTLGFGVAVFLSFRDRPAVEEDAGVEGLDPDAIFESTGTVVTQTTAGERDFVVEAERQLTFTDGTTRLEEVTITVEREDDRDFVITGRQAEVGDTQTQLVVTGDVRVHVSDGLVITTEEASYDDLSGLLEVPDFVEFARGRMHGSGVGAIYNRNRDLLRLRSQVQVTIGEGGGGRANVTSRAATLARDAHYMRFIQDVRIEQDNQTTTANRAIAYFDADTGVIEMLELRGEARMRGRATTPGAMERMQARDINLTYADTGVLQHATLAGRATIRLAGQTADEGQRIEGEWIDASLAGDGATVTALNARENVQVHLPAGDGRAERRVIAVSMEGRGSEEQGLTSAEFVDDVEYRERRNGDEAEDLVVRSNRLTTTLSGSLSAMANARFTGAVLFRDGDAEGTSDQALYDLAAGTMQLRSAAGSSGRPRVVDETTSVEADEIDLAIDDSGMQARGNVRSVLTSTGAGDIADADAVPGQPRMPGMFASDEPAYVTGGQLAYDSITGVTTYTGAARLWQGETAVQGDQIEIDERTSDLRAIGNARSSFILEEVDEATQESREVSTIATGNTMHYEDALRRVVYTTTAHVNGPQGDLTGDRIELYLGDEQRELDRVEAFQQVKLLITGRTATGMRLTYYTVDGRYVMHGAPVQILEELPEECRETRGKTLTFFRSTDTISVDGNEEVRTQSKTTGTCPAPQFH